MIEGGIFRMQTRMSEKMEMCITLTYCKLTLGTLPYRADTWIMEGTTVVDCKCKCKYKHLGHSLEVV